MKRTTKTLLLPPSDVRALAVERLFRAIHYSHTEKCTSITEDKNITIEYGDKYITYESSYYNKVILGNYDSANKYLDWLKPTIKKTIDQEE